MIMYDFFDKVSMMLNIVRVSCKRHGILPDARYLPMPGDTSWRSHYIIVVNIIAMCPIIRDALITLGQDNTQRSVWPKLHTMLEHLSHLTLLLVHT